MLLKSGLGPLVLHIPKELPSEAEQPLILRLRSESEDLNCCIVYRAILVYVSSDNQINPLINNIQNSIRLPPKPICLPN